MEVGAFVGMPMIVGTEVVEHFHVACLDDSSNYNYGCWRKGHISTMATSPIVRQEIWL